MILLIGLTLNLQIYSADSYGLTESYHPWDYILKNTGLQPDVYQFGGPWHQKGWEPLTNTWILTS